MVFEIMCEFLIGESDFSFLNWRQLNHQAQHLILSVMAIYGQKCLPSLALGGLFLKSKANLYLQGIGTSLYKFLF